MKNLIAISIVLLAFLFSTNGISQNSWYAPKSANTIENPIKKDKKSIGIGKKLYNQLCAVCHGFKGKGDGLAGASLNPKPANFTSKVFFNQTDGAIFWKLNEGRAPMASYKDLIPETDRWHLINFIRTLKK